MAPPVYRCPICQAASKSFRSLLHHVQWWHGFCRDSPPTPKHRGESDHGIPNYDLVRKRDAYLREQDKLRAKIDDFFYRTEAKAKLDREALSYQCAAHTSSVPSYSRQGPPAAAFYQEFWPPGEAPKEAKHPGHTDPSGVEAAAVQATETRRHQSAGLCNIPEDAYCAPRGIKCCCGSSHGCRVLERATHTKLRPRRLARKPRVKFALNAPNTEPSKPADLAENVLEAIIKYLSTEDLLACRRVCRAWKRIIERPQHWVHIELSHTTVSSELFSEMAAWCSATESLSLQALEAMPDTHRRGPGYATAHLEHGLERLLRACSKALKVLTVVGCDSLLTDRVLWLASACPFLEAVAYVTASHITLPEAVWSLGAGCRRIRTLIVPPLDPQKRQGYAGHRVCQMLAKCWPQLQVLCIGGKSLTLASICCVLRSCINLESFEIDRGRPIDDASAEAMVEAGLPRIKHLYFTHTVISQRAVVILQGACPRIKEASIILHRRDFGSASAFNDCAASLKVLQRMKPFDSLLKLVLADEQDGLV